MIGVRLRVEGEKEMEEGEAGILEFEEGENRVELLSCVVSSCRG